MRVAVPVLICASLRLLGVKSFCLSADCGAKYDERRKEKRQEESSVSSPGDNGGEREGKSTAVDSGSTSPSDNKGLP